MSAPTPGETSTGQTYAQAAAHPSAITSASAVNTLADGYAAEDVEPLDHLDALRGYEGEVEGNRWPLLEDVGNTESGWAGGGEGSRQGRRAMAMGGMEAGGSGPSRIGPPISGGRGGGRLGSDQARSSAPRGVSMPTLEELHDAAAAQRDLNDRQPLSRAYTHNPFLHGPAQAGPSGPRGNRRDLLDDTESESGGEGEDGDLGGYGGGDGQEGDDPAPWRSLYTHGNGPLDATGGLYTSVMGSGFRDQPTPGDGGDGDGVRRRGRGFDGTSARLQAAEDAAIESFRAHIDSVAAGTEADGMLLADAMRRRIEASSANQARRADVGLRREAGEEGGAGGSGEPILQRGGNNRRRTIINDLIARHLPRSNPSSAPISVPAPAQSPGRPLRQRSTRLPPTLSSSSGPAPAIRSTLPPSPVPGTGRTRERSGSAEAPSAKRRKLFPAPASDEAATLSIVPSYPPRPSYLSYSTLQQVTSLPSSFTPPGPTSHLALTMYTPLTPLPPLTTASTINLPTTPTPPTTTTLPIAATSTHSSPSHAQPQISFTARPHPRRREYADADASSLRTIHPIPAGVGVHYYEIRILDSGPEGYMSLGWVTAGVDMQRLVGWEKGTWGWHGDDGRAFEGRGAGRVFGPMWGVGDVVGAGVDFTTRRAFFTKNGKLIGHTFTNLPLTGLYPAIGLRNPRESVAVNFLGPFAYDIDTHVRLVQAQILSFLSQRSPTTIPFLPVLPCLQKAEAAKAVPKIEETVLDPLLAPAAGGEASRGVAGRSTPPSAVPSLEPMPWLARTTGLGPRAILEALIPIPSLFPARAPTAAAPVPAAAAAADGDDGVPAGTADNAEPSSAASPLSPGTTGPPPLPAGSDLHSPSTLAQTALVLDYLGHTGMDRVQALMVRDLERRGSVLPARLANAAFTAGQGREGTKVEDVSPARMIERACATVIGGGRVPAEALSHQHGKLAIGRKMRILDLLAMSPPPPSAATGQAGMTSSLSTVTNASEMEVEGVVALEEDAEAEIDEEAMEAGRKLMRLAKEDKWTVEERGWLNEAVGAVCGLSTPGIEGDGGVWSRRREEWVGDLRSCLRENHHLNPISRLEHALAYSRALISTLADGIDGSAALVDPKAFLEKYGWREVKGKGKVSTEG